MFYRVIQVNFFIGFIIMVVTVVLSSIIIDYIGMFQVIMYVIRRPIVLSN